MQIEYEATFSQIDKREIKSRLSSAGAILVKPEFLQRRVVFIILFVIWKIRLLGIRYFYALHSK